MSSVKFASRSVRMNGAVRSFFVAVLVIRPKPAIKMTEERKILRQKKTRKILADVFVGEEV